MTVMIAVPTRGHIRWETVVSLQAARDYDQTLPPIVYQQGTLSVALTRNRIVQRFLASDHDVLAMVDDDVAPPLNFVEMLLPHLTGDYGMVGLPHTAPHPGEPHNLILGVYRQAEDGLYPQGVFSGVVTDCDAFATGCVLISRKALEELGPHPFRIPHDPTEQLQSDDLIFCADLRAAGYRIGVIYDGYPVDHFRSVSLAPLQTAQWERA